MNQRTPLLIAGLLVTFAVTPVRAEVDFVTQIAPLLEKHCVECHGPEKKKGKLRLDSRQEAFGKEDVLLAGKADKSELYRRVTLPADDDDIMPAEGDPLSKAEQDLIRDWINEGAHWPESFVIAGEAAPTGTVIEWPPAHQASDAETKAIAQLNEAGIAVRPIAQNSPWLTANLRVFGGELDETVLNALAQVVGLVDLNLASKEINDTTLGRLAGLKNLMSLHLENTGVTDAGLKHLKGMAYLNYLNLYGTAVSDTGLAELKELKRLKKLYLWQTQATLDGAAKLEAAIPGLTVNLGEALVVVAEKKEEEKAEPKEKKDD